MENMSVQRNRAVLVEDVNGLTAFFALVHDISPIFMFDTTKPASVLAYTKVYKTPLSE